jgi:hypothetical protein
MKRTLEESELNIKYKYKYFYKYQYKKQNNTQIVSNAPTEAIPVEIDIIPNEKVPDVIPNEIVPTEISDKIVLKSVVSTLPEVVYHQHEFSGYDEEEFLPTNSEDSNEELIPEQEESSEELESDKDYVHPLLQKIPIKQPIKKKIDNKISWLKICDNEAELFELCGFTAKEFLELFKIIEEAIDKKYKGRGSRKLSGHDRFLMLLYYIKTNEECGKIGSLFTIGDQYAHATVFQIIDLISPIFYNHFVVSTNASPSRHLPYLTFPNTEYIVSTTTQPTGGHSRRDISDCKLIKSQCVHNRQGLLVHSISGKDGERTDIDIFCEDIADFDEAIIKKQDYKSFSILAPDSYSELSSILKFITPSHDKQVAGYLVIADYYYKILQTNFNIMKAIHKRSLDDYIPLFRLCAALTNYRILSK